MHQHLPPPLFFLLDGAPEGRGGPVLEFVGLTGGSILWPRPGTKGLFGGHLCFVLCFAFPWERGGAIDWDCTPINCCPPPPPTTHFGCSGQSSEVWGTSPWARALQPT